MNTKRRTIKISLAEPVYTIKKSTVHGIASIMLFSILTTAALIVATN